VAKETDEDERKMISRMARYLGCTGSHRGPDGQLMPCSTHEELVRISNRAEPKKKETDTVDKPVRKRTGKRRRRDGWEELGGRGPVGIDTLPGGGLVSSAVAVKASFIYGRARPRLGDPDVFTSPHAARLRARQLGCIGIARRNTPEGDVVWTPCSNNSDYRRRMGIGPQAARDRRRAEEAMIRRIRRQSRVKSGEQESKALGRSVGATAGRAGRTLRRVAKIPDAQARDADMDNVIQEGTIWERIRGQSFVNAAKRRPGGRRNRRGLPPGVDTFSRSKKKKKKRAGPPSWMTDAPSTSSIPKPFKQPEGTKRLRIGERMRSRYGAKSPLQLMQERSEYVSRKYGEITTAEKADEVIQRLLPNLGKSVIGFENPRDIMRQKLVDAGMDPDDPRFAAMLAAEAADKPRFSEQMGMKGELSKVERAAVEQLIVLAERHPNAAATIVEIQMDPPRGGFSDGYGELAGTLQSMVPVMQEDGTIGARLEQTMNFASNGSETPSLNDTARKTWDVREIGNSFGVTDMIFDDDEVSDEDAQAIATAATVAHEFGHVLHGAAQVMDLNSWEEYVARNLNVSAEIKQQIGPDLVGEIAQGLAANPNWSPDERSLFIRDTWGRLHRQYSKIIDFRAYNKDGYQNVDILRDAKNTLSKYAGYSNEETIAEAFAYGELGFRDQGQGHVLLKPILEWVTSVKGLNPDNPTFREDGRHLQQTVIRPNGQVWIRACAPRGLPEEFFDGSKPLDESDTSYPEVIDQRPEGFEELMEKLYPEWKKLDPPLSSGVGRMGSKAAKRRKARSDRAAATPAKPSERISGSSRNTEGSASSTSSGSKIEMDAAAIEALRRKVKEHNEKIKKQGKPDHTRASLGALKSVYRRGAGAFSSSHRPGMTRGRWAFARVNAFLHLLSTGSPKNSRYTTDNDLLPSGHPKKSGKKSLVTKVLPRDF